MRAKRARLGECLGWIMISSLAVLMAGCYRYTPVHLDELGPSQDVRARVSLEQAELLGELELTRANNPRIVEGRVAELLSETLLLDISRTKTDGGTRTRALSQRVDLPLHSILEVEAKSLNGWRTTLFVTGGAAVAAAALSAWVINSGGEVRTDLPPSDESLTPLRFRR